MKKVAGGVLAALLLSCSGAAMAQPPLTGVQVYEFNTVAHINTSTTTTPKQSAGLFSNFCVNTAGATANNATVYDSLTGSGKVLAVIDTTTVGCKKYDVGFTIGLTIVTATGAQADITVSFR